MKPLLLFFPSIFFVVSFLVSFPQGYKADIYMHNPRGSNDRNCERNANRNNGNRLFDSQNNAAGGYACPRAVGNEIVQNEDGIATFGTFNQDKKMYYYEGSWLPIEWTNQHGCGQNSEVNCEIVIQYMCEDTADPQVDNFWPWTTGKNNDVNEGQQHFRSGDNIGAPRDGIPENAEDAATDTIPDTEDAAIPDTTGDRRYGMQESWDYYQLCQRTERNKGLYSSDQRIRRNDQRGTRQNPNGNRNGFECPEERDYYPWWHPSPWVDIAVLSNEAGDEPCSSYSECTTQRCRYYMENSFNVAKKGYCDANHISQSFTEKTGSSAWQNRVWFNNKEDCENNGFTWYEISLSDQLDGLSPPTCMHTQYARVNQLGNAVDYSVVFNVSEESPHDLQANRFMWKIPSIPSPKTSNDAYFSAGMEEAYKSCVVRVRYNISTSDYPGWPPDAMEDSHSWKYAMVTSANNSLANNNNLNNPLEQNPYVYIGPGDSNEVGSQFVGLRINTNQYGRTFQDRSYKFAIKPRPIVASEPDNDEDTPYKPIVPSSATILNLNVRGKRGNIVQTYPAVEYNFVPDSLALEPGMFIHFQWTGSDYNPRRGCNNANGGPPDPNDFVSAANADKNSRADRSNMVFVDYTAMTLPTDYMGLTADEAETMSYNDQLSVAKQTLLSKLPCYNPDTMTVNSDEANRCYNLAMRLAFLNQQEDGGSLSLRRGQACLTEEELDNLPQNTARNHPLNCANINAKPYPYFDGGLMEIKKPGEYKWTSTRNNNFSNRDQKGYLCVPGSYNGIQINCSVLEGTLVLQDFNFATSTAQQRASTVMDFSVQIASTCETTTGANSDGMINCIDYETGPNILNEATYTIYAASTDNVGDGDATACRELTTYMVVSEEQKKWVIAVIIIVIGIFVGWLSIYLYNRRNSKNPDSIRRFARRKWFSKGGWEKAREIEMT